MAGVSVKVDNAFFGKAKTAVDSVTRAKFRENKEEIGDAFLEIVTPYVPLRTGELINSGHVVNTSGDNVAVAWNKSKKGFDIAREQYYHPHNHPIQGTDHWDKAAMAYEGDVFRQRCENILNDR